MVFQPKDIRDIRDNLYPRSRPAYTGRADGTLYSAFHPDMVYVRPIEGANQGAPMLVKATGTFPRTINTVVNIVRNKAGELEIEAVNENISNSSSSTQAQNTVSNPDTNWIKPSQITPLYCYAVGTGNNASTKVVVLPGQYENPAGTYVQFGGQQIDLSGDIPASGYKIVCVFLRTDTNVLESVASTTTATLPELATKALVDECYGSKTSGAIPIWAWLLGNNQSSITETDKWAGDGDLRPLFAPPSASAIGLETIAGATYTTVQEMHNIFHSSGVADGGGITDAGSETVNVAEGSGFIRATDNALVTLLPFDWAQATGQSIPTDTVRYIGVEYNSGSPQVTIRTTNNFNNQTDFILGSVVNEGGTLHIQDTPWQVGDHAGLMIERMIDVNGFTPALNLGGLTLSESADTNRYMGVSAGEIYYGLTPYDISTIDTSGAATFDIYYRDGVGGFTVVSGQSQWDNDSYDDGSGTLATMTNNRYAVLWFYIEPDSALVAQYGRGEYVTLAQAEAEAVPATAPDRIAVHGLLIGRLVFQKSATTAAAVQGAFDTTFANTTATNFADLAGTASTAQGGTGADNSTGADGQTLIRNGANGNFEADSTILVTSAVVINDAGADIDTRIESDNNANAFFLDAGNDRIGLFTASPLAGSKLHTNGIIVAEGSDPSDGLNGILLYGIGNMPTRFYQRYFSASAGAPTFSEWALNVYASTINNSSFGTTRIIQNSTSAGGVVGEIYLQTGAVNTAPSTQLTIGQSSITAAGQIFAATVYSNATSARAMYIDADGDMGTLSSSRKVKKNIQTLVVGSWFDNLEPVTFQYKNTKFASYDRYGRKRNADQATQFGLIAEDVEQVAPDLVSYDHNGRPETVNYHHLNTILLKAVQDLRTQVADLEARVTALEGA